MDHYHYYATAFFNARLVSIVDQLSTTFVAVLRQTKDTGWSFSKVSLAAPRRLHSESGTEPPRRSPNLTKAMVGTRPRDVVIKLFKELCRPIGVVEIGAVSDDNHPQHFETSEFELSYDEVWRERGGVYNGHSFFIWSVISERPSEKDIPAKRRTLYRKREAVFDAIGADLAAALSGRLRA